MPLDLQESVEQSAEVSIRDFYRENCQNAEKNKQKPRQAESWIWDTVCSYISLRMIEITGSHPLATIEINDGITFHVCKSMGVEQLSVEGILNKVDSVGDGEIMQMEIYTGIVTNEHNVLCVGAWFSEFSGGAHPNNWGFYVNYDIRNGKEISLSSLLVQDYETRLNALGERVFTETHGAEGWDFEPGKFELSDHFAITRSGLLFRWDPYEIGPYAAGAPEILIRYSEIRQLINPDGMLAGICFPETK